MAKVDLSKLQDFIKQFPDTAKEMGKAAALASGVALQQQMKDTFTNAGPSPSAPGNPPAIDTGTLRRSIQVNQKADNSVEVGSNLEYARYLEYGTTKMAARPWLNRSFNLAKSRMSNAAKRAMMKIYKDKGG
jgi:HK97 gp10 family phage protein